MASATEISKVKLGSTNYNLIAKNGIFYIEGTGSTAGTWLGSHADITAYYEGLTVAYKVPVAGASTTTLNINGLGATKVVKQVNTAVSNSYGVNAVVLLVYTLDSTTAYWKVADYSASGDITGVTAGAGLTGGGSSGSVTLNVGAGSGIVVNDNNVAVNTSYTTSGKNYKVAVDSTTGGLYVNVPWTDTNTDTDTGATSVEVTGSGNAVTAATYNASTRKLTLTKGATYNNYSLPTAANGTLGGVKTTSTVTSTSGLTACPIISGVPYYKDTNTQAVSSVNGQTGAVSLTHSDVGAAAATHNHAASEITSGTLAAARLPAATTSALGGVKIGSNISVSSGTISVAAITNAQIDAICNASISNLSEVNF